jgi:hypothetical protein
MSAWERSRFIPWDRIPLPDTRARAPGEAPPLSLEDEKERVLRRLHQEAARASEVKSTQEAVAATTSSDGDAVTTSALSTKVQYSHMDLLKQAAFGGCIGTITGAVFGFMDGMRTAGESPMLQKASNMAKGKYLLQGTTRSATVFGLFFTGFHVLKYSIKVAMDPGDFAEIGIAAPISLGALFARPETRPAMPYGAMLVFMDSVSMYMRKTS